MSGRFRVLHLRRFRSHKARSLLSVSGVAVGTALLATILTLEGSLIHSVEQLVDLAGQADVAVTGPSDTGVDEDLFSDVASTDGVETAVPVIRSRVAVNGEETLLFGFDERAEALDEDLTDQIRREVGGPREVNGLFLSRGLADHLDLSVGDPVAVHGGGSTSETQVVGMLSGTDAAQVNRGEFAAAALPLAQRFAGKQDRLDAVWALAAPGVDPGDLEARLSERVGERSVVSSPRLQAEQVSEEVGHFRSELLLIASAVLVVAGFLVFNTMSMTALERRRELATLRALGGRRGPLTRGFLGEALILGVIGSGVGTAIGILVARAVFDALPPVFSSGLGVEPGFHLPGSTIPIALATGVVATLLAALVPARRAVSVPPVEAMRPEGVFETTGEGERTVWPAALTGLAAMATGALMTAGLSGDLAVPGAGLLFLGSLVATWGFTAPITRATSMLASGLGRAGRLAAASLARAPRRTWSTTAGVTVAAGIVVAIGGITANERAAIRAQFSGLAEMDVVAQTSRFDDFPGATLMPAGWEEHLASLPGVDDVYRGQFAVVTLNGRRTILQGVEGGHAPLPSSASGEARAAMLRGDGLVASSGFAHAHGVEEGDVVQFSSTAGLQSVPVLEVVEFVGGGLSGGMAAVAVDRIETWFGRSGASFYELELAPGTSREQVVARVEEFVSGAPFPVFVGTGDALLEGALDISEQFDVVFTAMAWIAVAAAALGILNTLMLSVLERRRELGILRAIGTSRRLLGRTVVSEAAAIAVVGTAFGSAIGVLVHYAGISGAQELIGFPIDYEFTPAPLVGALVVAVVMAMAGGLGPGRRAASVNVIEAIGYE